MKIVKVGMIGFGTIGTGVAKILAENSDVISKRLGASVELVKVADLDITTDRGVDLPSGVLTTSADEVINHPEIDVLIELIGGYDPARKFLLQAIEKGKHIVTANKALLAKHGDEIFSAVTDKGLSIGFEASIGGAIPIIRSIREAFVANNIQTIEGIVNGTANYILSKMSDENCDFKTALKEAQEKGFAEADPTFDVEGIDSAHKIAVLTRLAYGTPVPFDDITVSGISGITSEDIECAREFGYRIKLLAISKYDGHAIDIRVHPAMIPVTHPMAYVNGALNAIRVCDDMMEENVLIGHGAGSLPTGSAVVGDVIEISRNIVLKVGERLPAGSFQTEEVKTIPLKDINEIESEYFLRFSVLDNPGVLSKISGILGKNSISIESMIQRGRGDRGEGVPLVMMCHKSSEKNIQSALKEIEELDVVCGKSNLIRVEK
ncbi:MAG: homoserine dehydrogenase [Nitrospinae bacterium]|nr:homoserine dehydrogenase [Nitrospinota bacterium]MZH45457.1 homoserine dehydrogenase [Nitrospinota bacterium]